ncbi:MAG: hypothetical protein R3A79_29975 [Nannocystaceae bacterium]
MFAREPDGALWPSPQQFRRGARIATAGLAAALVAAWFGEPGVPHALAGVLFGTGLGVHVGGYLANARRDERGPRLREIVGGGLRSAIAIALVVAAGVIAHVTVGARVERDCAAAERLGEREARASASAALRGRWRWLERALHRPLTRTCARVDAELARLESTGACPRILLDSRACRCGDGRVDAFAGCPRGALACVDDGRGRTLRCLDDADARAE